MAEVCELFGYEPYNAPLLEPLALYAAKSGRELVEQQTYRLTDRGGREVVIRPEMTPSLARMVAAKLNELTFPLRWYSTPNLWRYERPQRGRLREHWQLNVDLIGVEDLEAELEVLELAIALIRAFGATPGQAQVNYNNRKFLNDYLSRAIRLDKSQAFEACKAIDRRGKAPEEALREAMAQAGISPSQIDRVLALPDLTLKEVEQTYASSSAGAAELVRLQRQLEARGLADFCRFNPAVVRGLDYYTGTVFEMFDLHPTNRRAIFGGGRYDGLISLFGGRSVPAVGFGWGDVTMTDFLETHKLLPEFGPRAQVLVTRMDGVDDRRSLELAREIRAAGIPAELWLEKDAKFKKQIKYAAARGIRLAVIMGEDEIRAGTVAIKDLKTGEQIAAARADLINEIRRRLP